MTESIHPTPAEEPAGYDPAAIERKWQERWEKRGTNHTDLVAGVRPFYALMMFPYPSAEGLHVGNLFAFTGNDIYGRFQRLQGHTVFEPLGFDAFGIHSENFALKVGTHPADLIPKNIDNFRRQLKRAGLMIDWRHELSTTDPSYYKWTQWLFLQLYKRGLAYKKRAAVNWCPNDKTVLANEQVIAGECERCGAKVEQRFLEQWFFRITDYAGRLLANLDWLDWSESTKQAQRNWIGRSDGAEITFRVQDLEVLTGMATIASGRQRRVHERADRHSGVHDAARHDLRRDVPRARARASARRPADDGRAARPGRRIQAAGGETGPRVAQGEQGEDRRLHRFVRAQSGHADSRSPSGSPTTCSWSTAPARSWPFPGTTSAISSLRKPSICRSFASSRPPAARTARRCTPPFTETASARLVNSGQFSGTRHRRGHAADRRVAVGARTRARRGELSAARLVHLAAAVLGSADSDHLLRDMRHGARARKGSSRRAAVRRGLQAGRHRHLAAGARRVVVPRQLSDVRRLGATRDRCLRHVPRQRVVFPSLSEHRLRRRAVRSRR